nr:MAG TPA: hypothetical protein [Caudoviricetes sp.]
MSREAFNFLPQQKCGLLARKKVAAFSVEPVYRRLVVSAWCYSH